MRLFKKKQDTVPRRRLKDLSNDRQENASNNLFQRNRTLVGSISPLISSANELNASLQSPRAHSHHLAAHRRRIGALFVLFVAAAISLTWFLYEFTAGIHIAPVGANSTDIQTSRYTRVITDYLAARPLERMRIFMNKEQLDEYMRQTMPEVAGVRRISPGGFASTRFEIDFRKPVASWLIGSNLYYVDKNGVPFRVNYFEEPVVKIVDKSGVPQVAGTVVASSNFLRFVGMAVDTARLFGMQVKQATIPENTTRQIELRIAKHPYPIKLSLDRPVGEQVEDMKRAVEYLKKKRIVPKQYLDVRVSGKAYYK